MTSHELATDLAKLAEHLKQQPDLEIGTFYLTNESYNTTGEQFKAIAKSFPKPLHKRVTSYGTGESDIILESPKDGEGFTLHFRVPQNKVCKIVEPARPAVYDCEPLLTPEEEAELTQ